MSFFSSCTFVSLLLFITQNAQALQLPVNNLEQSGKLLYYGLYNHVVDEGNQLKIDFPLPNRPPENFFAFRPEWYMIYRGQLCYRYIMIHGQAHSYRLSHTEKLKNFIMFHLLPSDGPMIIFLWSIPTLKNKQKSLKSCTASIYAIILAQKIYFIFQTGNRCIIYVHIY